MEHGGRCGGWAACARAKAVGSAQVLEMSVRNLVFAQFLLMTKIKEGLRYHGT